MKPKRRERLTKAFFKGTPWWVKLMALAWTLSAMTAAAATLALAMTVYTFVRWNFS